MSGTPPVTGSSHTLPFERLSPGDFERLCLWLLDFEGYEGIEYLGASGADGGRDLVAKKGERRFAFQCKRVKEFGPADAEREVAREAQHDEAWRRVRRAAGSARGAGAVPLAPEIRPELTVLYRPQNLNDQAEYRKEIYYLLVRFAGLEDDA